MNCAEFDSRIHQLLDERSDLAADAALSRHAEACPHCERMLEGYLRWIEGSNARSFAPLSRDFSCRVVCQVCAGPHGSPVRPPRGRSRQLWAACGLVAAILLIGLLLRGPRRPAEPGAEVPRSEALLGRSAGDQPPSGKLVQSVPPAGPERSEVSEGPQNSDALPTAGDEDWRLLWQQLSEQLVSRHPVAGELGSMSPLADGIRPVATSLGSALDSLLRTAIPLDREPSQPASADDSAARQAPPAVGSTA